MYHVRATFGTAARIMRQLSHDHRTIALIFVVPCLLLALLHWLFEGSEKTFTAIAPALLGVFPFVLMFINEHLEIHQVLNDCQIVINCRRLRNVSYP